MRASKRIATAITFNFSFWCSSKELRRTHRPARPCKRYTCKKKTKNKQTNKQTKKHTCDRVSKAFLLVNILQLSFIRDLFTNFVPLLLSKPVQILFYAVKQLPCDVFVSMLAVGEMIKVFLMTLFSAGTHQSHCRTCYTIGR